MWNQPKYIIPSMDEQKRSLWYIHTIAYYPTFKKEENPSICDTTWINIQDIMLSEMSLLNGQILHDSSYRWYLKQSNSQKQKGECWLPEAGGKNKWVVANQHMQTSGFRR